MILLDVLSDFGHFAIMAHHVLWNTFFQYVNLQTNSNEINV